MKKILMVLFLGFASTSAAFADGYSNGSTVYWDGNGSDGQVVGQYPNGDVAVAFGNGVYEESIQDLAVTEGCKGRGYCVGDAVYWAGNGSSGSIVGIFQDDSLAIAFGNGVYQEPLRDLAKVKGCVDGYCVGASVYWSGNGASGSIVGIYLNGKVAVAFGNGVYQMQISELALAN